MSALERSFSEKVKLVESSLALVIKNISKNPGNYFYEEDLRSELFYILREKFNTLPIELKKDSWFERYAGQKVNPVRAEYGNDKYYYSNHGIKNIDIVVLSDEETEDNMLNNFMRPCTVVIELKYSTEKNDSKHSGFIEDIHKIRNAKFGKNFLGLAICFDLHTIAGNFKKDYEEKGIQFTDIEIENFSLPKGSLFAIYVTPVEVLISQELKSERQ